MFPACRCTLKRYKSGPLWALGKAHLRRPRQEKANSQEKSLKNVTIKQNSIHNMIFLLDTGRDECAASAPQWQLLYCLASGWIMQIHFKHSASDKYHTTGQIRTLISQVEFQSLLGKSTHLYKPPFLPFSLFSWWKHTSHPSARPLKQ